MANNIVYINLFFLSALYKDIARYSNFKKKYIDFLFSKGSFNAIKHIRNLNQNLFVNLLTPVPPELENWTTDSNSELPCPVFLSLVF